MPLISHDAIPQVVVELQRRNAAWARDQAAARCHDSYQQAAPSRFVHLPILFRPLDPTDAPTGSERGKQVLKQENGEIRGGRQCGPQPDVRVKTTSRGLKDARTATYQIRPSKKSLIRFSHESAT